MSMRERESVCERERGGGRRKRESSYKELIPVFFLNWIEERREIGKKN